MTYEEFEEAVMELLFKYYSDDFIEILKKRLSILKKKDPNYMLRLYKHTCFVYDNPHIYGETCKRAFDNLLGSTAVDPLREDLGLGMIPWYDLH